MPDDRDVSIKPELHRNQNNVPLTPRQRIGYVAMLAGFLLFTLFTAIIFGAVM